MPPHVGLGNLEILNFKPETFDHFAAKLQGGTEMRVLLPKGRLTKKDLEKAPLENRIAVSGFALRRGMLSLQSCTS